MRCFFNKFLVFDVKFFVPILFNFYLLYLVVMHLNLGLGSYNYIYFVNFYENIRISPVS